MQTEMFRHFYERRYLRGILKILYASILYRVINLIPFEQPKCESGLKKRIFLDVSMLIQQDFQTGIQRVVRNLHRTFSEDFSDHFEFIPVCASIGDRGFFLADYQVGEEGKHFKKTDRKIMAAPGDVFLGLDYAPAIILSQLAVLKTLKRMGVSIYFILHDLISLRHPEYFPFAYGSLESAWLREIVKLGGVICVSRTVREDLEFWLFENGIEFQEEHLSWFHHGFEKTDFACLTPTFPDLPKTMPLFLVVGTLEPRKGHLQTLKAFELLWESGIEAALIFVGRNGWQMDGFCKALKTHPQKNKRLFWLDDCEDRVLGALYERTDAVIVPSEAEGYGLPIIEAAAVGKPLILRDLPVFREIAGDNAFYFTGESPIELMRAINAWRKLDANGCAPDSKGIHISSWCESGAKILEIIGN